jgi:hypothetical protein
MSPLLLLLALQTDQTKPPDKSPPPPPQQVGRITYVMTGSNKDRERTRRYEATAIGDVMMDYKLHTFDVFHWSGLQEDGKTVALPQDSVDFRQTLSMDAGYRIPVPALGKVDPVLIGPITDLMTFYVDARLAMSVNLVGVGSHAFVKYGLPASWADGNRVLIGQDSIDFEVSLKGYDRKENVVTLSVRHVPPENPGLKMPAEWMFDPVARTQNNWVQVIKTPDGKFVASVGKEIFDVEIRAGLRDGRILSAVEDNVVEVSERVCSDEKLSDPGPPTRYKIVRHVEIHR